MSKPKLNNDDFCRAAKRLSCDVAAVKTVADVESKGEGFYRDGFPTILFERHKFRAFTNGKFNTSHPHLSGPAGGYGKAGQNQRNKFNQAFALDPEAAMKSCSWGKFQIMGFNYAICGFKSVGAFVDAMKESEGRQLDAFVSFVKNNGLADELRENDWAGFARGYNGADYRKNKYDTKMAAAYRKYLKEEVDCSSISSAAPAATPSEKPDTAHVPAEDQGGTSVTANEPPITKDGVKAVETVVTRTDGDVTVEASKPNEQDVNEAAKVSQPEPYQGVGFWAVVKRDLTAATGGNLSLAGLTEYAQQASGWPEWVVAIIQKVAVGVLIATIGYFVFRIVHYAIDTVKKNARTRVEAEAKTAVNRKDIEWV